MMELTSTQEIIASIIAYSFCSGTLVLLNKLTLHFLPLPSLVIAFQLLVCITFVYSARFFGVMKVDDIKWEYAKPYLLYVGFFALGVYANMRSLNVSNVETVIVFRALTPIIVSFLDAIFLGREWPSYRSWGALITLVVGAYGYASYDEQFQTQGIGAYGWPSFYTITIAFEMAYGKKIVKSVPLETRSGPVIYTNLLSIVPMLLLANISNEYSKFWELLWGPNAGSISNLALFLLCLGGFVGTAIGYSAWWCRNVVSATSFTLIGVINKCLTVVINSLIWSEHAKPEGIFCLFICIAGGIAYQQAPMKGANESSSSNSAVDVESNTEMITKDYTHEDDEMESLAKPSVTKRRP
uniref:Sugar phosphate transporter domain-containing protein n=1 Tax=Pseudo-nitzschia australis TaxID=44445 RepID=A0A6U9WAC8_9STRA|mmetsp:Transcript_2795/g.5953  ORF Transcript_2795/g.5953 Transcript_2795/m.5953 type:complete len:354 (+) Transcript_2795:106-1167(+)